MLTELSPYPYEPGIARRFSIAVDINDAGVIAGTSFTCKVIKEGAVLGWQSPIATLWVRVPMGFFVPVAISPFQSAAWQINQHGDVLVCKLKESARPTGGATVLTPEESFVWRNATREPTSLTAEIRPGAIVSGMNNHDVYVGRFSENGLSVAFKYDFRAKALSLLPPIANPGSRSLRPVGIDDQGRIVAVALSANERVGTLFWLPPGGTQWIATNLEAARYRDNHSEFIYQSDESLYARVSRDGIVTCAVLVPGGNGGTQACYYDLSQPNPPVTHLLPRVSRPQGVTASRSTAFGVGFDRCFVGEETMGSNPAAYGDGTVHLREVGHLLSTYVSTALKKYEPKFRGILRCMAINDSGCMVLHCLIEESVPKSLGGRIRPVLEYFTRSFLVKIPRGLLLPRRRFLGLFAQAGKRRMLDHPQLSDLLTAVEIADAASTLNNERIRNACFEVVLDIFEDIVSADPNHPEGIVAATPRSEGDPHTEEIKSGQTKVHSPKPLRRVRKVKNAGSNTNRDLRGGRKSR